MICFVLQGYGTPFEDNVSAIFHQMWILSIVHNFALFLQLPTLLEFLESRTPPTLLSPRLLSSCPSPPPDISLARVCAGISYNCKCQREGL